MKLGTGSLIAALIATLLLLTGGALAGPSQTLAYSSTDSTLRPSLFTGANFSAAPPLVSNDTIAWENFSTGLGPYSSPWGEMGFGYTFGGKVLLSGGAIDNGTNRSGKVELFAPAYSDLNLTLFSKNFTVQFSNPLGTNQTQTLVGLGIELDVPYLGTYTWEAASLSIEFTMELAGDSVVSGCGTGAGPLIWDGGGSSQFTACAHNAHPGEHIRSTLSNIRYVWEIGVIATASIPYIYTYTDTIVPLTPLVGIPAPIPSLSSSYQVVTAPSIRGVYASPRTVDFGDWLNFGGMGSGGAGNLTYTYTGTPGDSCPSSGLATNGCQATDPGTWELTICAIDELNVRACGTTSYTVNSPPPFDPWPGFEVAAVIGAVLLTFLLLLRAVAFFRGKGDRYPYREPYEGEYPGRDPSSLDDDETEGARGVSNHVTISRDVLTEGPTPTKSPPTRQLPPRDSRGRFARPSLDKRSHPGATPTKKSGHKGNRRPHR